MKKKCLWMRAAILIGVFGMMLASCSKDDNNNNEVVIVDPSGDGDDEYTIYVEPGLTMPVSEFETMVPATTDCDQHVISILKATGHVTDVKAFKLEAGYDYYKDKRIDKTAYYFNYKQLIDHNDPSKGWFKQQCVLTVAGKDRPTMLHTNGYALERKKNRLDSIGEPTLVSVLDANCLQVEYRYHGWSLPEGYSNKWNYLTAKQHSDDLHAIVTTIKKSGIISEGSKWVATGISKNGVTTAHYAYYYPGEMDAYVPFSAPFLTDLDDKAPYEYILTEQAFNGNMERLEKVKAAFRAYIGNKELQAECVKLAKQTNPNFAQQDDENTRISLLHHLFANYFSKMSYVPFERWEPLIPKAGDNAKVFLDFIEADDETKYDGESEKEYYRRKYYYNDLEPSEGHNESMRTLRRGEQATTRYDAYIIQTNIELGNYGLSTLWVDDLLTDQDREVLLASNDASGIYGVTYDHGKLTREFLEGMKKSTCNMKFVYGMQDPWTGGQIPDEYMGPNSSKLFIAYGLHNDAIDMWNSSERNDLFQWLKGLGFDL